MWFGGIKDACGIASHYGDWETLPQPRGLAWVSPPAHEPARDFWDDLRGRRPTDTRSLERERLEQVVFGEPPVLRVFQLFEIRLLYYAIFHICNNVKNNILLYI